jgi:LAS superfamily LD-carboxypeptidase LdcB
MSFITPQTTTPLVAMPAPKLGHFAYAEVATAELVAVGPYRQTTRIVQLRREAAEALRRMIATAAEAGLDLVPISGFRSADYQATLFAKSVQKRGSEAAAAVWVAPPGHSEHHTGLAVDLGEGPEPESDVEPSFGETASYRWLAENAARFGFEMSFPANNPQGVGCEPWHWRFVGNEEAERIFAVARSASPAPRSALRTPRSP